MMNTKVTLHFGMLVKLGINNKADKELFSSHKVDTFTHIYALHCTYEDLDALTQSELRPLAQTIARQDGNDYSDRSQFYVCVYAYDGENVLSYKVIRDIVVER